MASRDLGIFAALKGIGRFFINIVFAVFEFLTGVDPRTTEGYLKFLDYVCGLVLTVAYFRELLKLEWQQGKNWLPLILLFIFAVKYGLSRISVTQELAIGKSLFPPERIPDDLQLKDRRAITVQVVLFMALYMLLGLVADNIIAVSAIMTVIACGDFRTRDLINENIRQRFSDHSYAPSPKKKDYRAILARRDVARWYLFALPHLCKELLCLVGCATAFGLAIYGYLNGSDLSLPAYATLIGTQVLNEIITMWWRVGRYFRLKAIKP
jgi:hypothetical protein